MLHFIARRRWLFAAAALVVLIAVIVTWKAQPLGAPLAALLGGSALAAGGIALALGRAFAAMRVAFKLLAELKAENEALRSRLASDGANLRTRLALAERRLAALAIKLDVTEELDGPKS